MARRVTRVDGGPVAFSLGIVHGWLRLAGHRDRW